MNDIAEERPDFFEGEYLGADDLKQLVVYMRDQNARHALGGHAWGIASGLDLVEQPSPSGSGRDVYLLPGYAVDGYGRAVIVVNPVRLTVDRFDGQPAGNVPVWLYYVEGSSRNVRPGFEVCNASDTFSRVGESYEIAVGLFQDLTKRQSGITVGGETVSDAREAPRVFDDKGPIACDASVPYQDLPLGDEKKRWLIPLGLVNWQPGPPGAFNPLADPDRLRARQLRRYLGVVAESVLAADGLIRLRRRTTPWPTTGTPSTDDLCFADDLANPKHDQDLAVCDGRPEFNELVWVEGRMRVTDDTRLLDGRLEFRDQGGTNYWPEFQPGSPALLFERADNGNHADLRLLIGRTQPTDKQRNNFIVASGAPQAPDPTKPCDKLAITPTTLVTVQDDGKVGIGPNPPDQALNLQGDDNVFVHVVAKSGPNDLYVGATKDASVIAAGNDLRIRTGNGADPSGGPDPTKDTTTHVFVKSSGIVGIGTIDPDKSRLVTLEQQSSTYLIARTVDGPHEALLGADANGATLAANTPKDDLLLGADGGATKVWVKASGNVGVGTAVPDRNITAAGGAGTYINARNQSGREILIGADWTGTMISAMSNDDLQLRAGGNVNRMMIQAGGNVGIGTDGPLDRLDVRGNIRVGNGDLLVPGSPDNLRIITGNIGAAGNIIAGSGFTCAPLFGGGHYLITLLAPFQAAPVVVATVSASSDDDMASLANVAAGSFEIIVYDTSLGHRESNPFSFVALGLR